MRHRPLCVICCCFILLTVILTVSPLPVFWQEEIPETLQQTIGTGTNARLYGQIYRIQEKSTGYTIYIKNSILLIHSDRYSLHNSKITYSELPDIQIGDSVCVYGKVFLPQAASNPGQFDDQSYERIRRIDVLMTGKTLWLTDKSPEWLPELARSIKQRIGGEIDQVLPEEEAGVLKVMLLGDKNSLEEEVRLLYQKNGISHILAISGVHISLLGMGLYRLLRRRLSINTSALLSGGFLLFYLLVTDFPVSAQRAVFMFWISRGAECSGRTYDEPTAIALAAMIIMAENPLYIYDTGFQLSFGAAVFIWLLKWLKIRGKSASVYFWLCMLPLTVYYYQEISFAGILLNFLVLPPLGILLFLGLVGGSLGCVVPWLGTVLLAPAGWILKLYYLLCRLLSRIPWSSLIVGRPPMWQLGLYVLGLGLVLWLRREKKGKKSRISRRIAGGIGLALPLILILRLPTALTITMLDVGQGDCLVLQKNSSAVVVDGGSTDVSKVGQYRIVPYLKYQGIRHISSLVITHPDADHKNGLAELLTMVSAREVSISIDHILVPAWMEENEDWLDVRETAEALGISIVYAGAGEEYTFGGGTLQVVSPGKSEVPSDNNEGSLVFRLVLEKFSMLFTGDLGEEGESRILEAAIRSDVLKVGHHGSAYSSSAAFLERVQPKIALLSYGEGNSYGHPAKEAVERLDAVGAQRYATAESGAIEILPEEGSFRIRCYR